MVMPPGHGQAMLVPYRFSKREKWILGGVLSLVLALAVTLVISFASAGHSTGNGCVDVALPYSDGGAEVYRCGADARAFCVSAGKPGGLTGISGRALAGECRKAGISVG
jgi:hypothetical protein